MEEETDIFVDLDGKINQIPFIGSKLQFRNH
jgi:hypothetical protein